MEQAKRAKRGKQAKRTLYRRPKDPLPVTSRHLHILLDARLSAPGHERRPEEAPCYHIRALAEALLSLWSTPFQVFHKQHGANYGGSRDNLEALRAQFEGLFASVRDATALTTHHQVLQEAARLMVSQGCCPNSLQQ